MFGQSLAHKEITEETAVPMAEKIKEVIALGHAAGYDGGSIEDLIHGVTFLHAWDTALGSEPTPEK